ncbi:MAG TPA: rod shape-determining protein MreC, partial [Sphingomicrobium sp.]|nr:rod shape-determining protein MreC [Sphingomicrobium sp.]
MAAPAGPRPGWSRRAQYSLFFGFVAAVAGLIAGLIMLGLSIVSPSSYQTVRGAALDVMSPVTNGLSDVSATVSGLASGAGDYWDAADQNAALKAQNAALRRQI